VGISEAYQATFKCTHTQKRKLINSVFITICLDDEGEINNTLNSKTVVILELQCYVSVMPLRSTISFCSLIKLVHFKAFSAMKEVL